VTVSFFLNEPPKDRRDSGGRNSGHQMKKQLHHRASPPSSNGRLGKLVLPSAAASGLRLMRMYLTMIRQKTSMKSETLQKKSAAQALISWLDEVLFSVPLLTAEGFASSAVTIRTIVTVSFYKEPAWKRWQKSKAGKTPRFKRDYLCPNNR